MLGSVRRRKFEEELEIPGIFRKAKTNKTKNYHITKERVQKQEDIMCQIDCRR